MQKNKVEWFKPALFALQLLCMHIHFFESNCCFSAEKADNLICMCSLKKQNIFKKKKKAHPIPKCSFMSF